MGSLRPAVIHARLARLVAPTFVVTAATVLIAARGVAQYVPVRELDFNHSAGFPTVVLDVDHGVAVGYAGAYSMQQPVFWDSTGSTVLPLLRGTSSGFAYGTNVTNVVVGSCIASSAGVATRWTAGIAEDLNLFVTGGSLARLVHASDIDDHGRILCAGFDPGPWLYQAVLFDGGNLDVLGSLNGGTENSAGYRMNGRGVACGISETAGIFSPYHAVVFQGGAVVDLHDPALMTGGWSAARDLDRAGRVVGEFRQQVGASSMDRAFLWDGAAIVDLGALFTSRSYATSINDFGAIVGSFDAGADFHAFVYDRGTVTDLNTLVDPASGWVLVYARGIDNEGRIVGTGTLNGVPSAYIMEPDCLGSFATYGSGCAGSNGVEPRLRGAGCPAPDRDFALEIVDGLPNSLGFFFVGAGTGTIRVKPGRDLQVLPLALPILPIVLDGFGEWWNAVNLPSGTPIFDLNLQALFLDPGATHGISGTKPLSLHFE